MSEIVAQFCVVVHDAGFYSLERLGSPGITLFGRAGKSVGDVGGTHRPVDARFMYEKIKVGKTFNTRKDLKRAYRAYNGTFQVLASEIK